MGARPHRGLGWFWIRLQFYAVKLVGMAFALYVTYLALTAVTALVAGLFPLHRLGWLGVLLEPWYARAGLGADREASAQLLAWDYAGALAQAVTRPPAGLQFLLIVATYGGAMAGRLLYYRLRYRFARELLKIRTLLVFDPQMALVRQRLLLEQALADLTQPMQQEHDINLHDAIAALTLLGKLPERYADLANSVRRAGNMAAHPASAGNRQQRKLHSALDTALANQRKLEQILAWYRRNARRSRMTDAEWQQIRHQLQKSSA